MTLTTLNA